MLDGIDLNVLDVVGPRSQSAARPSRPGLRCNEAIPSALSPRERELMVRSVAGKLEELFEILQVDHRNDHNTRGTPHRVAKMMVEETMAGRYCEAPSITEFDNVNGFEELLVTGPIDLRSTCAHHLMPIYGEAYIGVMPSQTGKLIGLSKYDRIVDHFASRLQIQEELVQQIGDFIMQKTSPKALAVRISAVHMCKTHRGVHASHDARMVSTAYFGALKTDAGLKDQFQRECLAITPRR